MAGIRTYDMRSYPNADGERHYAYEGRKVMAQGNVTLTVIESRARLADVQRALRV
jgi:hypothetical protein